jgi:protein TonB
MLNLTDVPPENALRARTIQREKSRGAAASVAIHAAIAAVLVVSLHHHVGFIAPYKLPGKPTGTNFVLAYLPDRAPAQSAASHQETAAPTPPAIESPLKLPTETPLPASRNTQASPDPNATTGADALGSGNIQFALTQYFPAPHPDLSVLAHGTRGDVILRVIIGTDGRITDLKLLSGLGSGVDETVIATVEHWTFHPATQNGTPVASEQELRFHYERG